MTSLKEFENVGAEHDKSSRKWSQSFPVQFGHRDRSFHAPVMFLDDPASINSIRTVRNDMQAKLGVSAAETNRHIFLKGLFSKADELGLNTSDLKILKKQLELEKQWARFKGLMNIFQELGENDFLQWAKTEGIEVDLFMSRMIDMSPPADDFPAKVKGFLMDILRDGPLHVNRIKSLAVETSLDNPDHENWDKIKKIAEREKLTKYPKRGYWGHP